MKKRYWILLFFVGLIALYALGPKPTYPAIESQILPLSIPLENLDDYIAQKENQIKNLKPDNEARIVWADSIRKTPFSVVYLHGFSASQEEGDPVHEDFAKRYGCNMYLSRLAQHGIDDRESFKTLTPKKLIDAAKEAIAIGNLIGEKVIVMSCSTGGTLSAYLAAENPEMIDAQIFYSPNFELNYPTAKLLTMPWGRQLAFQLSGKYRKLGMPEDCYPYWTTEYRTEGIIALQALLDETMTDETYSKITQPSFVGYYYKNEEERDDVISMKRIQDYIRLIDVPDHQKRAVAFPDAGAHVMTCYLQGKDLDSVRDSTFAFAEKVLGMKGWE